jgi:hypothetical protein
MKNLTTYRMYNNKKQNKSAASPSQSTDRNNKAFSESDRETSAAGDRLCAHELFASFTADIIKENTLFTR